MPRIIGHALLALALLSLAGCSTWRVAYQQSETLVYWWVDRHLDLTSEQKPLVQESLADWHRWHRQQQLPEYLDLLQRARAMALREVSADEICQLTQTAQAGLVRLVRRIEPPATRLLVQLQPEQLQHLRQRYERGNVEWREEWLDGTPQQRLQHRVKQALERLENSYGRLDATQREMVTAWLSQSGFDAQRSYDERLRRQADSLQTFERMMQVGQVNASTQALLRGWVDRAFESPDSRQQAYVQALWQANCQGFARLHNSTTPEQRQRLLQTLQGYENDVRKLMR